MTPAARRWMLVVTITVALADGRKGETTCSGFAVTSRTRVSPVR